MNDRIQLLHEGWEALDIALRALEEKVPGLVSELRAHLDASLTRLASRTDNETTLIRIELKDSQRKVANALSAEVRKVEASFAEALEAVRARLAQSLADTAAENGQARARIGQELEAVDGALAGLRANFNRVTTAHAEALADLQSKFAELNAATEGMRAAFDVTSTETESIKREVADRIGKAVNSLGTDLVSVYAGTWREDKLIKRGQVFTYRGSTYLCLRDTIGIPPSRKSLTGSEPRYAVIALAGAPGAPGEPGTGGGGGGPGTGLSNKVSFPATTATSGADGDYSVNATELAVYVTGTGWVFFPGYQK